MSKKQVTAPAESLKMNIELADNGIIIRNLECEDDVILATSKDYGSAGIDHDDEYKAIGKKIFDWMYNDLLGKMEDFIVTNFDIEVQAKAKGRDFSTTPFTH